MCFSAVKRNYIPAETSENVFVFTNYLQYGIDSLVRGGKPELFKNMLSLKMLRYSVVANTIDTLYSVYKYKITDSIEENLNQIAKRAGRLKIISKTLA